MHFASQRPIFKKGAPCMVMLMLGLFFFVFLPVLLGYLNQVDLREKADLQEKEAHELLDSGKNTAITTKNLLETLSKPDQNPLFYAGGIEILTEMMKDCKPEMCVSSCMLSV